jgi:FkbM family methyltransferase
MSEYFVPYNCQVKDLAGIYKKYFGYVDDGFFVDVGAYNGFDHSNTYCLASAGWKGICYEPIPEFYNACVNIFSGNPKIKVIQTCVGDREGEVKMTVAGTLSTYSEWHTKTQYWKGDYQWKHEYMSPITTLDKSLKDNNVTPNFEVLSVDVEGSETDVLKFFDIKYWRPKMAIIEAQEFHPAEELRNQAPFINKYFEDAGYEKIYSDEINNIYVPYP